MKTMKEAGKAMKVYMTRKNADMTEGRGPMVNNLCFLNRKHAEEYINRQFGVMGRRPSSGSWTKDEDELGDWDVVVIEVHACVPAEKSQLRKRALKKLTPTEREALELEEE